MAPDYRSNRAKGLCGDCSRKAEKGKSRCRSCLDKIRERAKARKKKGLCAGCTKAALPGKARCQACTDKNLAFIAKRSAKRREQGICIQCGKRKIDKKSKSRCRKCLDKAKNRTDPKKSREKTQAYNRNLRITALEVYGGSCKCCGESEERFLCIDHIEDNGADHRREIGGGGRIYRWLKKNDYPSGFQTLCANCNMGKHMNKGVKHMNKGVCPHVERR
jgi:hypothetical protein